ncbi:MAG TPA: ABC transporter ATP-binding protein [Acidocella sp.]|jgi:iron(III) transport system ATP-binding protein|nr:ABC transporter ATP-binding protein [Acidocella sp.]
MATLQIEGLCKSFRDVAVLDGVDLDVVGGGLVAVLGASGSGKTTLLRLIAGFERVERGRIAIGGQLVAAPGLHVAPERRGVGYVMQEGALFPHLSVADNILFGLAPHARRGSGRVADLLDLVGLPQRYAPWQPHRLSGGEQQRVALARALAPAPKLVLLDEPFSALDAALRGDTRRAVAQALRAVGATGILVTHDQSEALSMGAKVAVLRRGRLVQVATPMELYRHPVDAELARFIGEAVLVPGTAAGHVARCGLGTLVIGAGPGEGPVELMVRPEQIRLLPPDTAGCAQGQVLGVTFYGHDAVVEIALAGTADTAIAARLFSRNLPEPGETVGIAVQGAVVAYPVAPSGAAPSQEPCGDPGGEKLVPRECA